MRNLFAIIPLIFSLIVLLIVCQVEAADVTLAWDANTEPDLAGYYIYYGTASREYGAPITVGLETEYTITGLPDRVFHYFAVTARDTEFMESLEPSNEVICADKLPPGTVININVNCN